MNDESWPPSWLLLPQDIIPVSSSLTKIRTGLSVPLNKMMSPLCSDLAAPTRTAAGKSRCRSPLVDEVVHEHYYRTSHQSRLGTPLTSRIPYRDYESGTKSLVL